MWTDQGRPGSWTSHPARLVLLAMVVWLCAAGAGTVRAQGPRESLDKFPQATVEISAQDGPQHFHIWLADTTARSEQGLMYVQSLAHDWGMLFPRNNQGPMAMPLRNGTTMPRMETAVTVLDRARRWL